MTQIFVFGSSNAYGVGGPGGGWADKLKTWLHEQMFATNGIGEKHELYNFGKPGATIQFVKQNFPALLKTYGNNGRKIAVVSVGGNNVKAEDLPENFVSSIEEYTQIMADLLKDLQTSFDQLIVMGYRPYDEKKTLPKPNPLTGGCSYFWNARTAKFSETLKKMCAENNYNFIDLNIPEQEWIEKYLCVDGLHPNDAGYQLMFEAIKKEIQL
jgi:lysophospholipase L1-like esterase